MKETYPFSQAGTDTVFGFTGIGKKAIPKKVSFIFIQEARFRFISAIQVGRIKLDKDTINIDPNSIEPQEGERFIMLKRRMR